MSTQRATAIGVEGLRQIPEHEHPAIAHVDVAEVVVGRRVAGRGRDEAVADEDHVARFEGACAREREWSPVAVELGGGPIHLESIVRAQGDAGGELEDVLPGVAGGNESRGHEGPSEPVRGGGLAGRARAAPFGAGIRQRGDPRVQVFGGDGRGRCLDGDRSGRSGSGALHERRASGQGERAGCRYEDARDASRTPIHRSPRLDAGSAYSSIAAWNPSRIAPSM